VTRTQRGSAIPFAAAAIAILMLAAMAISVVGGALVSRRQAASAADLAALAGATAVQHGRDGCAAARRSTEANGASLDACSVAGPVVEVRVSRPVPVMFGRELVARAVARAGPR
jgi:secretion/DNA translocation related TadE-like protein